MFLKDHSDRSGLKRRRQRMSTQRTSRRCPTRGMLRTSDPLGGFMFPFKCTMIHAPWLFKVGLNSKTIAYSYENSSPSCGYLVRRVLAGRSSDPGHYLGQLFCSKESFTGNWLMKTDEIKVCFKKRWCCHQFTGVKCVVLWIGVITSNETQISRVSG